MTDETNAVAFEWDCSHPERHGGVWWGGMSVWSDKKRQEFANLGIDFDRMVIQDQISGRKACGCSDISQAQSRRTILYV
jgi:hypothetical protein